MTRRDFELIASILKASKPDVSENYATDTDCAVASAKWIALTCEVSDKLAKTNARFDASLFLKACGR